jgi:hypothetical protein
LAAKEKKKENLGSFTVGSVQSGSKAAKGSKGAKTEKVEIKEKDFPILTNLRRAKDLKPFQQEMQRILVSVTDALQNGTSDEKKAAEKVQKAYGLALAVLENSRLVR